MEILIVIIVFVLVCIAIGKAGSSSKKSHDKPTMVISGKSKSDNQQIKRNEATTVSYSQSIPGSWSPTPIKSHTSHFNGEKNTSISEQGFLHLDGKDDSSNSYKYTEVSTNRIPNKITTIKQLIKKAEARGEEYITEVCFEVKGLYYRDTKAIIEAEQLVKGDVLNFEPEPDNPRDRNAIKLCTERNIFIGYLPASCAQELAPRKKDFIDCYVQRVKKGYDVPYVKAKVRYYGNITIYSDDIDVECLVHKVHDYITPAMRLKKAGKFDKAAQLFIQAGEKEQEINDKLIAYTQACMCLRKIKNYEKEIEAINLILSSFSSSLDTYKIEEYQKRLETATKFYNSQLQKKETMRNSKKGRLIANIIDSVYLSKMK